MIRRRRRRAAWPTGPCRHVASLMRTTRRLFLTARRVRWRSRSPPVGRFSTDFSRLPPPLPQAEPRDLPEETRGGGQQVAPGLHPQTQGGEEKSRSSPRPQNAIRSVSRCLSFRNIPFKGFFFFRASKATRRPDLRDAVQGGGARAGHQLRLQQEDPPAPAPQHQGNWCILGKDCGSGGRTDLILCPCVRACR